MLYNIPRFRGTDYVAPGEPVHGWELADVAVAQGNESRPGDTVCIRNGLDVYFEKTGTSQGIPNPPPIRIARLVHHFLLPYMGTPIIDNADFEATDKCDDLGRWEFQYVCAPLVLRYGTGSPVNPLAIL